ncbi:MAG: hypothetical protein MPW14_05605 [Candidatus Manganitrophus sp.]|nr:MAG: hypothetical protein MPW14_05605 [Candidatus Manganitrophus sp.]
MPIVNWIFERRFFHLRGHEPHPEILVYEVLTRQEGEKRALPKSKLRDLRPEAGVLRIQFQPLSENRKRLLLVACL